jgi:hypothetical protein
VQSGLVRKRRGPGGEDLDGRVATVELDRDGPQPPPPVPRERAHQRCRSIVGRVSDEKLALARRQINEMIRKGTE